jgi:hypothetical protein
MSGFWVFVRAKDETGRWGSANALDLDERSFRVFVLDSLEAAGLLIGLRDGEGVKHEYQTKPGYRFETPKGA